ncbi:MAG: hypothetical protein JW786_06990 [Desulfobacterales bacterium]|nr:hypothetical protein [Desulfobacterales bacterium]
MLFFRLLRFIRRAVTPYDLARADKGESTIIIPAIVLMEILYLYVKCKAGDI